MRHLLDNAAALLVCALAVALAGSVAGHRLLPRVDPVLRGLARWIVGLAFWTVAAFVLAAAGGLGAAGVGALVAALVAAFLVGVREPRSVAAPAVRLDRIAAVVLGIFLLPLFVLAISPAVSWDASAYHLTVPKLYLAAGGFRPIELNVYAKWPLGVELLYALAMATSDFMLAKAFHFGFALLTVYAVVLACRQARGRPGLAGWWAAAFVLANPVVAYEARIAYVDLAHAFFLLAAVLFLSRALDGGPGARAALAVAGFAGGLTAGVKVTGIVGAALVGLLALPRLRAAALERRLGRECRQLALAFALPVAAFWVSWLVKAAIETGNPVYPFFHDWLGGPDWNARLQDQFVAWQQSMGMGRSWFDYLLLPLRVVLFGATSFRRFDGRIGLFWLALVPAAIALGRREPLLRRALFVVAGLFVFWASSSQQMRFLIPVLPLLAIVSAVGLERWSESLSDRPRRRLRVLTTAGAIGFLLAVVAPLAPAAWGAWKVYRLAPEDLRDSATPAVFRFVNRLPADAKLLFLNWNGGFFCQREYLADSFFEASQIAEWLRPARSTAEVRELLDQRGVTHLLWARRPWADYPPALLTLLRDPRQVEVLDWDEPNDTMVLRLR